MLPLATLVTTLPGGFTFTGTTLTGAALYLDTVPSFFPLVR